MRRLLLLCMLAGTCAADDCGNNQSPTPPTPTIVKQDPSALQYVRDERVGLCFARYSYSFGDYNKDTGYSIAAVDCEKLKGVTAAPVESLR